MALFVLCVCVISISLGYFSIYKVTNFAVTIKLTIKKPFSHYCSVWPWTMSLSGSSNRDVSIFSRVMILTISLDNTPYCLVLQIYACSDSAMPLALVIHLFIQ